MSPIVNLPSPYLCRALSPLLVATLVGACSASNPAALIPPGDRALIQQEDARDRNEQQPITVAALLAHARGTQNEGTTNEVAGGEDVKGGGTANRGDPNPADKSMPVILLHVTDDTTGQLALAPEDVRQLAALGPPLTSVILSIGPSGDASPVAAALAAPGRAKFVARYLPHTLQVAETRYDVSLAPNTARLEFGEAERAH